MNWRVKAALLNLVDAMPYGEDIHYWLQRNLTRTLPHGDARLALAVKWACDLVRHFNAYSPQSLGESTLLEFGAGRNLVGPLTFYCLGAARQLVLDIRPLAKPDLVNACIGGLATLQRDDLRRRPQRRLGTDAWADLRRHYGISYLAPRDARATALEEGTLDCVTSTNTLEHIPVDDIRAILRECRRILRPDGIVVMRINYEDHYAFFDKTITTINFLRYSDAQWRKFNPGSHYQNRLRHADYLELFDEAGFRLLDVSVVEAGQREIEAAGRLPLDARFRVRRPEELGIKTGWVVLGQPG